MNRTAKPGWSLRPLSRIRRIWVSRSLSAVISRSRTTNQAGILRPAPPGKSLRNKSGKVHTKGTKDFLFCAFCGWFLSRTFRQFQSGPSEPLLAIRIVDCAALIVENHRGTLIGIERLPVGDSFVIGISRAGKRNPRGAHLVGK